MSLVEQARARLEEVRDRAKTRLETVRGGSSGLGGGLGVGPVLGSSIEFPKIKEIREKGILTVLEEKFPRVKEIRERGILARGAPSGETPSPAGESPPVLEEKERRVRGARVLL